MAKKEKTHPMVEQVTKRISESKVVTVQDMLTLKDPEKYTPMFSKEGKKDAKVKAKSEAETRELLQEIEDLEAENAELKSENAELKKELKKDK